MWIVSILIDLAGFLGALSLAVPFFLGEPQRVRLLLGTWQWVRAAEADREVIGDSIRNDAGHLAKHWKWELRFAKLGAALIAAAFLGKIAVSFCEERKESNRDLPKIKTSMLRVFDAPQNASLFLPAEQRPSAPGK